MSRSRGKEALLHRQINKLQFHGFVEALLKSGPEVKSLAGFSLIEIAAREGLHQQVLWLLSANCRLENLKSNPLYLAIKNKHLLCAKLLLLAGASIANAIRSAETQGDAESIELLANLHISPIEIRSVLLWHANHYQEKWGVAFTWKIVSAIKKEQYLEDFHGLAELAAKNSALELVKFYYQQTNSFRSQSNAATVGYWSTVNDLHTLESLYQNDNQHVLLTAEQLLENGERRNFLTFCSKMNLTQKERYQNSYIESTNNYGSFDLSPQRGFNQEEKLSNEHKKLFNLIKYDFAAGIAIYRWTNLLEMLVHAYKSSNYVAFTSLSKYLTDNQCSLSQLEDIALPFMLCQNLSLTDLLGFQPNFKETLINLNIPASSALYQLLCEESLYRKYDNTPRDKKLLQKQIAQVFNISHQEFINTLILAKFKITKSIVSLTNHQVQDFKEIAHDFGFLNISELASTHGSDYFIKVPQAVLFYLLTFLSDKEKALFASCSFSLGLNKISATSAMITEFYAAVLDALDAKPLWDLYPTILLIIASGIAFGSFQALFAYEIYKFETETREHWDWTLLLVGSLIGGTTLFAELMWLTCWFARGCPMVRDPEIPLDLSFRQSLFSDFKLSDFSGALYGKTRQIFAELKINESIENMSIGTILKEVKKGQVKLNEQAINHGFFSRSKNYKSGQRLEIVVEEESKHNSPSNS